MPKAKGFIKYFLLVIGLFIFYQITNMFIRSLRGVILQTNIFEIGLWFGMIAHVIQFIIGLILLLIISKITGSDNTLNFNNKKLGFKIVFIFTIITLVISVGLNWAQQNYGIFISKGEIIEMLIFQLFFTGIGEEIYIRAVPIMFLVGFYKSIPLIKTKRFIITLECVISALIFSAAHIIITFSTFKLDFSYGQLIITFVLGLIFGVTYEKTKSIVYPMMLHGIYNFLILGIPYMCILFR